MSKIPKCFLNITFVGDPITTTPIDNPVSVIQVSSPNIILRLKEVLAKTSAGPCKLLYLDDEGDKVSLDSEEEIKEFSKFATKCSSEGKPVNLLVIGNILHQKNLRSHLGELLETRVSRNPLPPKKDGELGVAPNVIPCQAEKSSYLLQWKTELKSELKKEILLELGVQSGATVKSNVLTCDNPECEGDADCLVCLLGKKKGKLDQKYKKLEKKERHAQSKLEHHLEKLERKKKKLLEKTSMRAAPNTTTDVVPMFELPAIMSGIASTDTTHLSKKVVIGKMFNHTWRIINDGTVAWKDVQLLHFWSSPGLEPDEQLLNIMPIVPRQECEVIVKFRAPKTVGPFLTYWHLVHGFDKKQFGHYVSLTGTTKEPKVICLGAGTTKVQDFKRNSKDEVNNVTFNDNSGKVEELAAYKSLASAEIAAEMAREAEKALLKRSRMEIDNVDDKLSKKCCEQLNVVDSGSETDENVAENEETDINEGSDPEIMFLPIPVKENCKSLRSKDIRFKALNDELKSAVEGKENNVLANLSVDITATDAINANKSLEKEPLSKEFMEYSFSHVAKSQTSSELPGEPFQQRDPLDTNNIFGRPIQTAMCFPLPAATNTSKEVLSSQTMVFPPPPPRHRSATHIFPVLSYPQITNCTPVVTSPQTSSQHLVFPPPSMDVSTQSFFPATHPSGHSKSVNYRHEASSTPTSDKVSLNNAGLNILNNVGLQQQATGAIGSATLAEKNQNIETSSIPQSPIVELIPLGLVDGAINAATKDDTTVQILPPGLVDGAINVATQAFSTACNALNTLRNKDNELQAFDPMFENNMALLVEMGFRNTERNARLLKRFHNDVTQVIGAICASPAGDNLEID